MNILFVHSVERPVSHNALLGQGQIQFGISYISAVVQSAGHHTSLLVLNAENERHATGTTKHHLLNAKPDIVAFTSVSSQFPFVHRIATLIRRHFPTMYIVVGGPHVSMMPEDAVGNVFDAICIGEGESAFLELVDQLSALKRPLGVPNFWFRQDNGSWEKNSTGPMLDRLDDLPFPDFAMWDPYVDTSEPHFPTIVIGRGCPHRCSYCSNAALSQLADGCYVRFRSPESIITEIRALLSRLAEQPRFIFLETDTITANPKWTSALCDALMKFNHTMPEPLRFHCNLRITPKSTDESFIAKLAEANIRHLNIGLESGSERVRQNILRRRYSNDDFRRVIDLTRKYGIDVSIFNMIGIPGETFEDHLETVALNRYAQPANSLTSIFYPYPGTELYQVCVSRGILPEKENPSERRVAVLDLPEFPKQQVQRAYDLFDWRIHLGYRPLHVNARKLIRHYIGKSNFTNRMFNKMLPIWHRLHD